MILLVVGLARAVDAHGAASLPAQTEATTWAWQPVALAPGTVVAGTVIEVASSPLEERTTDAGVTAVRTLLGPYAGATLGAQAGLARGSTGLLTFGVGAHLTMPVWLEQDPTANADAFLPDAGGGVAAGDARVDVPLTLVVGQGVRIAAAVVPGVSLPSGSPDRFFGEGAVRLRGRVALSVDVGPFGVTLDVARRAGAEAPIATAESGEGARVSGALRARVAAPLALGVEGLGFRTAEGGWAGEALIGAAVNVGERWTIAGAGGTALGGAPGTSAARGYLRVARSFGREAEPEPVVAEPEPAPPAAPLSPGRHDAIVQVRDPAGVPLDATVEVRSMPAADAEALGIGAAPLQTGPDGEAVVRLAPGAWSVCVHQPGRTSVTFAVSVAADAPGPASLVAVLHAERGAASLGVRVRDGEGAPIEGAELRLDDGVHARTSTGGDVEIAGLAAGPALVEASASLLRGEGPVRAELTDGRDDVELRLTAPPGAVRVRARDADGLALDAQILAIGPDVRGPQALGPDGAELVLLAPGTWTVAASSSLHGLQEREVTLSADDRRAPLVDFVYPPLPVGDGELCVRAVDPDGQPTEGLTVRLDGAPVGRTATGGAACVAGLVVGEHEVSLESPRIRPVQPRRVVTGAGVRELLIPVQWAPGELDVEARTTGGLPIDADVRFVAEGAAPASPPPAAALGPDGWGSYTLPSGAWNVVLSAPGYGAQERAMIVEPGATHLLGVEARLAREEGDGALLIEVRDPDGGTVGDARVDIDGIDRGRTSNGGSVRVRGLSLGAHRVRVSAPRIAPTERDVQVTGPDTALRVDGAWQPGTVRLRALGAAGPASDAMVLLTGAGLRGPLGMDPQGELLLHLDPGAWNAFASSSRDGEGERDFDAPDAAPPPRVDVTLVPLPPPAPDASADLLVMVLDPDDEPVSSARVRVGAAEATTGPDGVALFEGLSGGDAPLVVTADAYASDAEERVSLHAGPQQRTVRLRALPRAVDVRVVRRVDAAPLDAEVRVEGRVPVPAAGTGADGVERLSLLPGVWSVAARAEGVGADVRDVVVPAGTEPLAVDFALGAAQVTVEGVAISFGAPIRFATGTARIESASDALLREVAAELLLHPEFLRVALRGHTDDVGDPTKNLLLSRQRAEAVRDRLVTLGVPADRLTAEGYGDTRPIASNRSRSGRTLNRRVEFVVERLASGTPPATEPSSGK